MKRFFVIAAVAFCALTTTKVPAQNLLDLLKGAATTAVDKATDGKLTEYALVGTWSYTGPGAKMESGDAAQSLSASLVESALESQLGTFYEKVGLKPGAGSVTFAKDGTFTAVLGEHKVSGNYTFDATNHKISVSAGKAQQGKGGGSIPAGNVYLSGTDLMLVFPITKIVDAVEALGEDVSQLSAVSQFLKGYDNVYVGAKFSRQ